MTPLFKDPEMTLALDGFTSFLFVCLSNQTEEGRGQTAVVPGSHHVAEKFFRSQHSSNVCIGPEGPGWPQA